MIPGQNILWLLLHIATILSEKVLAIPKTSRENKHPTFTTPLSALDIMNYSYFMLDIKMHLKITII